ncbi:RNA polymerase sigma factor [Steroidobacter sp.]|uniref:RNA polymerase sigma factor n=1 Tax=Steroidobacter sp. TaxID=1978227 RepID=UPI001A380EB1|nr:sigma-70 family RNA polymerase sigma factor [Steroidobacter sp.]MBL8267494.1 sigma-70 family RNA polymerase sigma factor [Steroidobacter sp.]
MSTDSVAALNDWFAEEILPHEAALERYLKRAWRNREELYDLRQEIYVRVFEAAGKARPHSPRLFLFSTAKHLLTDRVRRSRVLRIDAVGDLEALNLTAGDTTPEHELHERQQLMRLANALRELPPRCREVVWLRRVDELSQKEVASLMNISEKTVETQIMKGTRLLASAMFATRRKQKLQRQFQ